MECLLAQDLSFLPGHEFREDQRLTFYIHSIYNTQHRDSNILSAPYINFEWIYWRNRAVFHLPMPLGWCSIFKLTHFALNTKSWNTSKDQYNPTLHGLHSSMEAHESWGEASYITGQVLCGLLKIPKLIIIF